MRFLKIFSCINIISSLLLVLTAYINGLGCNYTMKYWLPDLPISIYSSCNKGLVNFGVAALSSPGKMILELDATLFSLGSHQFIVLNNIDKMELDMIDQFPFKKDLQMNLVHSATIKRFNSKWVGIFSDIPLSTAFMAEIEGSLNMQERLNF